MTALTHEHGYDQLGDRCRCGSEWVWFEPENTYGCEADGPPPPPLVYGPTGSWRLRTPDPDDENPCPSCGRPASHHGSEDVSRCRAEHHAERERPERI